MLAAVNEIGSIKEYEFAKSFSTNQHEGGGLLSMIADMFKKITFAQLPRQKLANNYPPKVSRLNRETWHPFVNLEMQQTWKSILFESTTSSSTWCNLPDFWTINSINSQTYVPEPSKGAKWFLKGVNSPSLRV